MKHTKGSKLERCRCDTCVSRRENFDKQMEYMHGGLGTHQAVIHRQLDSMPEPVVKHMREMLSRMNRQGPGENHVPPAFQDFCKTYKRDLRNFVKPYVHGRMILAKKKRFNNKRTPMGVAFSQIYKNNPKMFRDVLEEMTLHD